MPADADLYPSDVAFFAYSAVSYMQPSGFSRTPKQTNHVMNGVVTRACLAAPSAMASSLFLGGGLYTVPQRSEFEELSALKVALRRSILPINWLQRWKCPHNCRSIGKVQVTNHSHSAETRRASQGRRQGLSIAPRAQPPTSLLLNLGYSSISY